MEGARLSRVLLPTTAAAFILGAGFQPTVQPLYLLCLCLAALAAKPKRVHLFALLLLAFLLGGARAQKATISHSSASSPVWITARAIRFDAPRGAWEMDELRDQQNRLLPNQPYPARVFTLSATQDILPGDWLRIRGRLEQRGPYRSVRAASWVRIGHKSIPWLMQLRMGVRQRLSEALPQHEAALAMALLLGERSGLETLHKDHFRQLGLLHLLAVSGMHLWLWNAFLQCLLPKRFQKARLPLILLVAGMAGFQASVVRACSALFLREWSARRFFNLSSFSIWGGALWCEVLLFPERTAGLGLLLSYSATAGILLAPSLGDRTRVTRVLVPSLAAFLATAPWLHELQGTLEPWSILLTPVFAISLAPRIMLSLLSLVPYAEWVTSPALQGIRQIEAAMLEQCARWPASPWLATQLPTALLFLLCGLSLYWLHRAKISQAILCLIPLLLFLPIPGLSHPILPRARPSLLALPVGHGLSILVAGHHESLLFDFGSQRLSPMTLLDRRLIPELSRYRLPPPSRVLYSHHDADHISGAEILQSRLNPTVEKVWPGETIMIDFPRPWSARILGLNAADPSVSNNRGAALEVTYKGRFRAVLLGDASGWTLQDLQKRLKPGPIDMLLLPHHGLTVHGLGPLLDHLKPRVAWVSCSDEDEPLPARGLLAARGIPVKTTASGSLFFPVP
ncbi:MAG: MBL fold metallo-hydrolase [Planctomycetes bacterium]|jgi:ComEC/Rec2-related protein|nr:MBL fold metallo-hydrolase [Planctomycetota bacterium]MBT4028322.1 MBL fold metallo-hydrolase [Planctomycetota bacterium]MBT4560885.1 MBL fold metallo-hydrolase [Planctomycetota bacterium]MBT5120432.1 MBL fold metallo-hydrolase [Planctomycetota bacterium]MBT7011586.1 MBL fold metallo-hydrolase [Planctomycetota bacterium]